MSTDTGFRIEPAIERDLPGILACIRGLAEDERLAHEVTATEKVLRDSLEDLAP